MVWRRTCSCLQHLFGRMEAATQDVVQNGELAQDANLWAKQKARFRSQWRWCAQGGYTQEREEVGVKRAQKRTSAIRLSLREQKDTACTREAGRGRCAWLQKTCESLQSRQISAQHAPPRSDVAPSQSHTCAARCKRPSAQQTKARMNSQQNLWRSSATSVTRFSVACKRSRVSQNTTSTSCARNGRFVIAGASPA